LCLRCLELLIVKYSADGLLVYKCYLLQEWQITNLSEDDVGGGARVVSAGRRSNRDEIMEICRLVGCEDVVIK